MQCLLQIQATINLRQALLVWGCPILQCTCNPDPLLYHATGYRMWTSDIRSDDSPLEADLAFTCKLNTDKQFIGREALEKYKSQGIGKRLVCLTLPRCCISDQKLPRAKYSNFFIFPLHSLNIPKIRVAYFLKKIHLVNCQWLGIGRGMVWIQCENHSTLPRFLSLVINIDVWIQESKLVVLKLK